MSPTCRPALQAGAKSQQLGNRSRKGTSFLSRAGNLGQKWRGEERSKGEGYVQKLTEVPGPEASLGPARA